MNPPIKDELTHGGQTAVVLGFISTFLLGIVFIAVMGNLLGQISQGVKRVNMQLSGASTVLIETAGNACLNATIRAENQDILTKTDKNRDAKIEEIINRYDSVALNKLSSIMYDCILASVPDYAQNHLQSVRTQKSGSGYSVETAVRNILY